MIEVFDELNEDLLFEMCNLQAVDTGLPYDIWLDSKGVERTNTHHKPRVKILVDGQLIPIEISDNPDIPESVKKNGIMNIPHLNKIKKYIKAYKRILLAHYFKELSDKQALNLLSTIDQASNAELRLDDLQEIDSNYTAEYYWDAEEMLYIIELKLNDKIIESGSALDSNQLFHELLDIQLRYKGAKIVDRSKDI